jgi:DNA-binding CsgD family transcriptional regulator
MFGLTASEADVAYRVSEGATLQQIADSRTTASTTVRSQMKAIMSKLDCRRQSEVLQIVLQIARSQHALGAEDLLQLGERL